MSTNSIKKLSCQRCRYRKLKCSRTTPCGSCAEVNQACEYLARDRKKRPVSAKYVAELEDRVAYLESCISRARAASEEQRAEILETVELDDHQPPGAAQSVQGRDATTDSFRLQADNLERGPEGSLIYHGPTSIIHARPNRPLGMPAADSNVFTRIGDHSHFDQIASQFGICMDSDVVTNALMLFFKWQYPQFMFIYREAFLRDHFGDLQSCKYWSSALVLSICALGLLMSPDSFQRRSSEDYFSAAETMLLVFGFTRPSTATVQAFLCLAFYEIGRGNSSKGWGFSGIAFRMAQDLGFQRDPKFWVSYDSSLATAEDIEIRRRIYWGCYTSDKLISLTLGRPGYFSYDEAEVEDLERLPDFPELEPWLPVSFSFEPDDFGETQSLIPFFKKQIELAGIIEQMLEVMSSSKAPQDGQAYQARLDRLNLEMTRWEASLPPGTQWNRWEPTGADLSPCLGTLHILFHAARLAMNIDAAILDHMSNAGTQKFREYCDSSAQIIVSLTRRFRSQYGLRYAPLVSVYSLAQASRWLSLFGSKDEVNYLGKCLRESATTWQLANEIGG